MLENIEKMLDFSTKFSQLVSLTSTFIFKIFYNQILFIKNTPIIVIKIYNDQTSIVP